MLDRSYAPDKRKYDGFLTDLYKNNEFFLILSAAIFLSSIFIGYAFAGVLDQLLGNTLKQLKEGVRTGQIKITTFSIFMNNFKIAFFMYLGGFLIGTYTALSLFINGAFIGYAASQFDLGDFIIFTIPHGIFEVTGIIIAGAAGFRLASCLINILKDAMQIRHELSVMRQMTHVLDVNFEEFKESLILFAIAAILLIIAAFIEANFTIAWANYIRGMI